MFSSAGAAILGIVVLRQSWGRPGRSILRNTAGWLLLVAGAIGGWVAAGAWGMAVAALVATGIACLVLALAAFEKPKAIRRAGVAENGATSATSGGWHRGILTFFLTGPLALIVAVAVALAVRSVAIRWWRAWRLSSLPAPGETLSTGRPDFRSAPPPPRPQ